ncbi:hypothetical protein C8J57DRAFT_1215066 [Mycena rebaudengoi]|nr:hypothetical protein C8J57DRAFT_1215066 [Mycena rebaudengoi]
MSWRWRRGPVAAEHSHKARGERDLDFFGGIDFGGDESGHFGRGEDSRRAALGAGEDVVGAEAGRGERQGLGARRRRQLCRREYRARVGGARLAGAEGRPRGEREVEHSTGAVEVVGECGGLCEYGVVLVVVKEQIGEIAATRAAPLVNYESLSAQKCEFWSLEIVPTA